MRNLGELIEPWISYLSYEKERVSFPFVSPSVSSSNCWAWRISCIGLCNLRNVSVLIYIEREFPFSGKSKFRVSSVFFAKFLRLLFACCMVSSGASVLCY